MRELIFLQRNEKNWTELEEFLKGDGPKDPDKLSSLYIKLNDDLSYARTFYPESNIIDYLNGLSVQLHKEIYKNKKVSRNRFIEFFKTDFPESIYHLRWYNLITLVSFLLSIGIGWLSASIDTNFTRLMMGNAYVETTLENIANGKAMNIYGQTVEGVMFFQIAANNLYVLILYFLLGLIFGLGSIAMLFRFGIVIGSFFQFMYTEGVFAETMIALWMHGVIEITCAIVASAAGARWGMSYIFPGTYTRGESFNIASKQAFKTLLGLLPLIVIAAFIESYITRHYTFNIPLSLLIIVLTLLFVAFYLVYYPYKLIISKEENEPES